MCSLKFYVNTESKGFQVPLIFIGHSMGGLVIKKAFILGHAIPELKALVHRVCGIFFLATPHQGADLAQTLSRILAVALGPRPFLQDLSPDSPVLESINEEFPRHCSHLQLFSFFENKPMNYIVGKGLIVNKQCAVMNYVNERKMYLEANHRDVARFNSPNDPSYIAIRNALATYIEDKRGSKESAREQVGYDQLEALNKFLAISDAPEDDVMIQDSIRLLGSCEWFPQKDYFQQWKDAACSRVLWMRGRPGAGKSVLSGHIINYLRDLNRDCCFFFFSGSDKPKVTINLFLRSMAWQMAVMHSKILSTVLEVAANWQDGAVSKVDHNPIWRRLYLRGILKVRLNRPQYWVIDALDECKGASELVAFLTRAQEHWPLCILVTSRNPVSTYISSTSPRIDIVSESILEEDTKKDISLFLKLNLDLLPSPSSLGRKAIADQILEASNGCFMWVNLVFKDLRQVNASAEIKRVLATNPEKMDELYSKILTDMANAKFGKDVAKAILTWTTCSFRPLSTEEIHQAIELDIKDTIDDVKRSISTSCGSLIYVDSLQKVQLIHSTAREFLTRQDLASEFAIEKPNGHRRLALTCLHYLSSSEMRASRPRKLSVPQEQQEKSPFADYACKFLFQHISYIKSYDDEVLIALSKFLGSINVLSWIEYLATQSDLQLVFQAGKTINNLLNLQSQHTPPLGLRRELSLLGRWGNDLIHLVTKFGKQITLHPSSIHQVIPPFCPLDSAIKQQFSSPHRGFSVQGLAATVWDDCLSIINYSKPVKPMTVATSDRLFAMGMSTGKVIIYDDITCQETQTLDHQEPVWCLAIGETGKYLASSGAKSVRVWNIQSWSELFKFSISYMCMALTFTEQDGLLLGAIKNNTFMCWDIINGGILRDEPANWTRDFEEQPSIQFRRPTIASFSPHQNLLAIVYRGEDILLWDCEGDRVHDVYEKESGSHLNGSAKVSEGATTVWSLAFSLTIDTTLLAAAYSDGDVVVYDTSSGMVRGILTGINAQILSCSPDGRTLASADSRGIIQLYDFETLKFIYSLECDGDEIGPKALAFTSDSRQVIDIRGNQCRIWGPTVLLRQDADDENSDTVSASIVPQEVNYQGVGFIYITAVTCVRSVPIVFCGKEDGSVYAYDISSEPQGQFLFVQTPGVSIIFLHFDIDRGILTCGDSASRVVSREVVRKQRTRWEVRDPLLDIRAGMSIKNILTCGKHSRVLVSTDSRDTLWAIPENTEKAPLIRLEAGEKRDWIHHAINPDQLVLISVTEAKIYSWSTLECLSSLTLSYLNPPFTAIDGIIPLRHPRFFATVAKDPSQIQSPQSVIQIWDFKDFNVNLQAASFVYNIGTLSASVEAVVGVAGDRFVFLHTDRWICSIDLFAKEGIVRHFFIPNDWISSTNHLLLDVGRNGEIVFVKRAELAVIKRGLEITEKGSFSQPRKRIVSPRHGALHGPSFPNESIRYTA